MGAIISLSIKGKDGKYKNYTVSINDETNQYGQNVTMYESQTKEERDAKTPKKYIGNGEVVWLNGNIKLAEKKVDEVKQVSQVDNDQDLPF